MGTLKTMTFIWPGDECIWVVLEDEKDGRILCENCNTGEVESFNDLYVKKQVLLQNEDA